MGNRDPVRTKKGALVRRQPDVVRRGVTLGDEAGLMGINNPR